MAPLSGNSLSNAGSARSVPLTLKSRADDDQPYDHQVGILVGILVFVLGIVLILLIAKKRQSKRSTVTIPLTVTTSCSRTYVYPTLDRYEPPSLVQLPPPAYQGGSRSHSLSRSSASFDGSTKDEKLDMNYGPTTSDVFRGSSPPAYT